LPNVNIKPKEVEIEKYPTISAVKSLAHEHDLMIFKEAMKDFVSKLGRM